jgi:LEA14-like dessication related protein
MQFFVLLACSFLCFSCKTMKDENPPDLLNPSARLIFERAEAETVEHVTLRFTLEVKNPRKSPAILRIQNWEIRINDQALREGTVLVLETPRPQVDAEGEAQFPLRLEMNLRHLRAQEAGTKTEYTGALQIQAAFAFDSGGFAAAQVTSEAFFPRIQEPEFSIISIAVGRGGPEEKSSPQAKFRLGLLIDNPNLFPLELSGLSYSFYGDGNFWAQGAHTESLPIPAQASVETYVYLLTNTAVPKQLAALQAVQYRLTGESRILTNMQYLPEFRMDFDLSGDSRLKD